MNELEKNIFKTISWFDIFDYPLTSWEIYKFSIFPDPCRDPDCGRDNFKFKILKEVLEKSETLKNLISQKHGFYFLRWRDNLVKIRKERYIIAERKFKKIWSILKILAHLPFIKLIAISDGLSYSNSKNEDDIDLFIITSKNRIWLVRFLSILILKIFKARPSKKEKKDKICLNFFITEDNLNLEKIMIKEENGWSDIYFIYWLAWLYPIYTDGIWQNFIKENQWLKKYLPHYYPQEPNPRRKITLKSICQFFKKICEKIHSCSFNGLSEKFYRWLQIKIMPKHLKEIANKNTSVIINNKILKFHDKDKREEYREKFRNRIVIQ